ncbi:insulinase family protein, partial [Schnuerera sp.]|uniref:insulinase family protein n=1 Tax=Schnuerera sp. TaxID=2794844 RepID=UPI002BA9D8AB
MDLEIKRINISKGINLNIICKEESKVNSLSVYFILPLDRKQVTANALLPLVLKMGTKELNTYLKTNEKLEGMQGLKLSTSVNKKGEKQVIRLTIEVPRNINAKDQKYFLNAIIFLKQIIFELYLEDRIFISKHVENGKRNLNDLMEKRKKDMKHYSNHRCIEEMFKNERYSISPLGYSEDLKDIDNNVLHKEYLRLLSKAPMEIFYVGQYENYIEDYIKDIFKFDRNDIYVIERENITRKVQTKNMIYEDMDIDENWLVIGYRTGILYENPLYYGLLVANQILGVGNGSKLYKYLKESKNLVYNIDSKVHKYKSFILIDSKIKVQNYEEIIIAIRNQINQIKNGEFSKEDIYASKKSIINTIESIKDNNILISEFFL